MTLDIDFDLGLRLICRYAGIIGNYTGIIGNYTGTIRQIIIMLHYKPDKTLTCKLSSSYLIKVKNAAAKSNM